jgi:hypothetical protein
VIDIQLDVSGSAEDVIDLEDTGQICVVQGPCKKVGFSTTAWDKFWTIRVTHTMIVNKRLEIRVTWKDETVATRILPSKGLTKPPPAQWDKGALDDPIDVCFGPYVPPRFTARLLVAHSWYDAKGRLKREGPRTFQFSFDPNRGFVTSTYRGRAYRSFGDYCLGVSPTFRGVGERVGFFSFTYIFRGKKVSSARYRYSTYRYRRHLAKQGSDEYFNYCVKKAPETIFSSGGVLMCSVPGFTLFLADKK